MIYIRISPPCKDFSVDKNWRTHEASRKIEKYFYDDKVRCEEIEADGLILRKKNFLW